MATKATNTKSNKTLSNRFRYQTLYFKILKHLEAELIYSFFFCSFCKENEYSYFLHLLDSNSLETLQNL